MTVVAVWFEPTDGCVWCVADTRFSRQGEFGKVVLTDSGSKIFSLRVTCATIEHDNIPHGTAYLDQDFGFAYAGNSLPALMTISSANTLMHNLFSADLKERVPSLEEIGYFVRKLADRFSNEVWLANKSTASLFQAVLFGKCPRSGKMEIYRFDPETHGGKLSLTMKRQEDVREIVVLGSGRDQFSIELKKIQEKHQWTTRLPKHAIRAMIESGSEVDVGGSISQAIANSYGFHLYQTYEPKVVGSPATRRHFNGIDLDEIGMIGPCSIGGVGMAG